MTKPTTPFPAQNPPFTDTPRILRASFHREDLDYLYYIQVNGTGVQIIETLNKEDPFFLTVFVTTAEGLYFDNSIGISKVLVHRRDKRNACVLGINKAITWFRCAYPNAAADHYNINTVIQHLFEKLLCLEDPDTTNAEPPSPDQSSSQLTLF